MSNNYDFAALHRCFDYSDKVGQVVTILTRSVFCLEHGQ